MSENQHSYQLLSLNGVWEVGLNQQYDQTGNVPGLVTDPTCFTNGDLWYRRSVTLPAGTWTHATLILYGARFCPSVYVNGELVSTAPGGMTTTTHQLHHTAVRPTATILLEIALKSLRDVDQRDASFIPHADHWRSNISSSLWDHVQLRLHGSYQITSIIPHFDPTHSQLLVSWHLNRLTTIPLSQPLMLTFRILDHQEQLLTTVIEPLTNPISGRVAINLNTSYQLWSPDHPTCYQLKVTLSTTEWTMDEAIMTLGLKTFATADRSFLLNNEPIHLRAGTVVWQRWLRDPEARELAFDTHWFEQNILLRLKEHGANTLRFHLGTPPESLLDLCDHHGMLVQIEWHFFHGMTASFESLCTQWRAWLDLCLRHPSVCLIHPWNETEGEALAIALAALEKLTPDYPPLVISHRDVLHIHKYWWSLFENVGLYYDSSSQFPLPIMVDEFGGNYVDGEGQPGGYPALKESFLRFLGRNHTAQERLQLQTEATSQIAEYWRRLGAAGFSPFCILGSPEDGNHYFLGKLNEANPKPVWAALTAAYAPQSCSLEVWDRNYLPCQNLALPLTFFNETAHPELLLANIQVTLEEETHLVVYETTVQQHLPAYSIATRLAELQVPSAIGTWRLQAVLQNPQATLRHPVISSWRCRTLTPHVPGSLQQARIGVSHEEEELFAFCAENQLQTCSLEDPEATLLVTSAKTWHAFEQGTARNELFEQALHRRQSILMLDIGPQKLGYGYTSGARDEFLQGSPRLKNAEVQEIDLFAGLCLRFQEVAEPESCLHPAADNDTLWAHLDQQATWLWNGLRGGLIVPATSMELLNINADAFLISWQTRAADPYLIEHATDYMAYELAGFYAFSNGEREEVAQQLRERVVFLVTDAPSLAASINPYAPIRLHHLSAFYRELQQHPDQATTLTTLATCGKNLARSAILQLSFGPTRGRLLLSQAITGGRLAQNFGTPGLYGLRYDPAAVQFTLNMLQQCLIR